MGETELDLACLLVGRFLLRFSQIEAELDHAVRKLFQLTPDGSDTICANIDFFRKVNVVRSALTDQIKDEKQLANIRDLFGRIAGINDLRTMVAHSSFEAHGAGGIKFARSLARTRLERTMPLWTVDHCNELFKRMADVAGELRLLTPTIAPYYPGLDFSDPRNSMYLGLFY